MLGCVPAGGGSSSLASVSGGSRPQGKSSRETLTEGLSDTRMTPRSSGAVDDVAVSPAGSSCHGPCELDEGSCSMGSGGAARGTGKCGSS